jgi:hypothetical protein
MLVLLMGAIHEVRRWNELRCHDTYTNKSFQKDWFRLSEVIKGYTYADSNTHLGKQTARWYHKPTSIFTKQEKQAKNLYNFSERQG